MIRLIDEHPGYLKVEQQNADGAAAKGALPVITEPFLLFDVFFCRFTGLSPALTPASLHHFLYEYNPKE